MAADTQHFVVSIDEGNSQGVYCAYCGEKIIPARNETGAYYFQCDCEDAAREKELYLEKSKVEQDLESFLILKTDAMQVNELRTRIVIYEQHVHELKKRLQEITNRVAGVTPEAGISTLVLKLDPSAKPVAFNDEPVELTDEIFLPAFNAEEEIELERPQSSFAAEDEEVFCRDIPMVSAESSAEDEDYEELCSDDVRDPESLPLAEDFESF